MKKNLINCSFAFLIAVSGCGSTQKIERDRAESVRSIAIIGFGLQQMRPNEGMDVVKALAGADDTIAAPIAKPSALAEKLYSELSQELASSTGWQVMDYRRLRGLAAYEAFAKRSTQEPQMRPFVGRNVEVFVPAGIVEGFLLGNLSDEVRVELMRQLGVDAVAIVTVSSNLINDANVFQKLTAQGKFRREVGIRFAVYDRHGNDPIWFDGKSREESQESEEHSVGFSSASRLDEIALATAKRTFSQLGSNYKNR